MKSNFLAAVICEGDKGRIKDPGTVTNAYLLAVRFHLKRGDDDMRRIFNDDERGEPLTREIIVMRQIPGKTTRGRDKRVSLTGA